jgi:hypothetical protein
MIYQIKIKGLLDRQWTDWFGGLTIHRKTTATPCWRRSRIRLLHGLLKKARDSGMPLVSVGPSESDRRMKWDRATD